MSIKLIPVEPKKNVLVIALKFMHGDADAYTYKHFNVKIEPEKSGRIEEILTFLQDNIWRVGDNEEWGEDWSDDEDDEDEDDSKTLIQNDLKVDGYNMSFVIDGIHVSVEGDSDATTDHSCAAYPSLSEVVYYDEECRAFKVTGY